MRFPQRFPRLTLLVFAAVTLVFGLLASGFRVDSAVDKLLPRNDPDRLYYDEVKRDFGSEEITVIGIFADDVFSPAVLEDVEELTREISRLDGVRAVDSLANVERSELDDLGLGKRTLMPSLPLGAVQREEFRNKAVAHRVARKTLVAPDGRATGLSIRFALMSDEEFVRRGIDGNIRALVSELDGSPGVGITGLPTIKVHAARAMLQDLAIFVPVATVVVIAILLWSFHTWRGVLLPLGTVLIGVIWTAGLMAFLGDAFTMGTLVLPPLLIAVGIAYAIHIVSRYYRVASAGHGPAEVVAETMRHVRLPVVMAAVTTLAGFATFFPNPIPSIRDFGLYSAFGITAILAAALTAVPAALTLLAAPRVAPTPLRDDGWVGRALEYTGRVSLAHSRWVLVLGGIVVLVCLWGVRYIHIETDYLRFFSPDDPIRIENEWIGRALAGTQVISVIVDAGAPEAATRIAPIRALRELQGFIDRQRGVDKTISLLDYVDMLRETLDFGSAAAPLADQRELDDLVFLLNPKDIERTLSRDHSRAQITTYTRLSGSAEVRELVRRIETFGARRFPPGVRVTATGTVVLLNRSAVTLARGQITGLLEMSAVLVLLLVALFRSLRMGLLSLVPNAVPIIVLFGVMGWFGVDLNISTCLIGVVALGIAVDDTIHYLTTFRSELRRLGARTPAIQSTVRTVGRPILITSVALSAGFLVVCFSNFQPIRHFGILASVTMVAALLADLFLLPALLAVLRVGEGG